MVGADIRFNPVLPVKGGQVKPMQFIRECDG